MQCHECGKHLRLDFKEVRVDTLYKEYHCRNGHKTIYRRYGMIIEINGIKESVDIEFDLATTIRHATRKRQFRYLLPETSLAKSV